MRKVLKASAGTGKTYSMSLEYLASLIKGQKYNEILVMTFTKKATAEIKERILTFLEKVTKGYFSECEKEKKEALSLLSYIEDEYDLKITKGIIKDLKKSYIEISRNKDKLEIHTIDGFTNKLFKKIVAKKRGILSFEMETNEDEILETILERIVTNKKHYDCFEAYFIKEKARDISSHFDLIKAILENRWKNYLIGKHKPKEKFIVENMLFKIEDHVKDIYHFGEKHEKLEKVFAKWITPYVALETGSEKERWIEKNRKEFFKKPLHNGNQVKGQKNEGYKNAFLDSLEDIREELAKEVYNEEIISFENLYFEFSEIVYKIYDKVRFEEKKFSFNDISYYTLVAMLEDGYVKDKKLTEQFYKVYGTNFKTIFIDEFQDTSILQWKILQAIINTSEDAIIVGDEKQSIYGWRGGERKLFEKLETIIDADVKELGTSYRSGEIVIDFVNDYFKKLEGWKYEEVGSVKKGGYVEVNIKTKDDDNAELIAERIKEEGIYKGVGVLGRKNDHLLDIARALDEREVPYVLNTNEIMTEYEACRGIYSLLEYLNTNNYLELLKFFREKPTNINGNDFKDLLENKIAIEEYLNKSIEMHENQILNKIELNVSEKLTLILLKVKKIKNEKSYRYLGKKILEEFSIFKAFKGETERKNIVYFLKLMNKSTSLGEFLLWTKENSKSEALKRVKTEDEGAVKIMSIHKSKGLEFETQYFYWVRKAKINSPKVRFYLDFDEKYEEINGYMVCKGHKEVLEKLNIDYDEKRLEMEEAEELNNLYVALTRAEKNLIIYYFGDEKLKGDRSAEIALTNYLPGEKMLIDYKDERISTGELISEYKQEKEESKEKKQEKEGLKKEIAELFIYEEKISHDNTAPNLILERKRKDGLALHYFMEFIYFGKQEEIEYATRRVYQDYSSMIGKGIEELIEKATNFVSKELENKSDKNSIFNSRWEIYNEFEIEDDGILKRIDRLMIDRKAKEAMIIDFKDNDNPEKKKSYQKQVQNYIKMLKNKLPEYEIDGKLVAIR